MGAPVKGEMGLGDMLGLRFGAVVDWSQASTTIFTGPSGIVGAILMNLIARTPTGTQPLSYTVKINGTTWQAAIPLSGLVSGLALPLTQSGSIQPYCGPGQTIVITPLAVAAGTCTFDLIGYYF